MFPIFLSNKKCRLEHVVNNLMSCLITEFPWIFSYKPHGIESNSMDTLSRYGIPWNSIGTSENPMKFHGPPRRLHGISWHSMELHHYIMELRGIPWHFMELHGYSLELHGIPRNSIDTPWTFRGIPWNSMDFHRFPWNSMRYFTQVLTVSSNEKCQLFYG